jgi:uncharacterized membrane protein YgcG
MKKTLQITSLLFFLFCISGINAEVIDPIQFFTKDAVQSANQKIQEIKSKTGKEFVLETIETTEPTDSSSFAMDRAKSLKVNGVYVLIAKKEKKIEIKVGNKTKSVFTANDSSNLKAKLIESFKTKNFDSGLENAVSYYSNVLLSANSRPSNRMAESPVHTTRSSSDSGGFSFMSILFFGLILFVAFRVISAMMGGGGYSPGMGGMGGGGMGFFGSLMTGMLGAVAGNWLYDKFMGNDSLSAHDNSSYSDSSSDDWKSQDDSYSSDSGSFDDSDSGGGDW